MRTLRDASPLAEHQLVAVERLERLLDRYGGAILADEPGLGKSFVAAELAQRLAMRSLTTEIIVPSSLVRQWEETLRRSRAPGKVITHASLLSGVEETRGPRLVVVDEAHAFRNDATQRYDALARRTIGARVLLVTATPVCNSARDLESLLRIAVTDDALLWRGVPSIDLAFERRDREAIDIIVAELLIRRDRTVLPAALAFGDLERRVIWTRNGTDDVDRRIADQALPLVSGAGLVRDFLRRRLDSSEAALLESIRRQLRFYDRALECLASGRALPKREYRRAFAHEEDAAAFQTVLFWEMFVDENAPADPEAIRRAVAQLDELRSAVDALPRAKESLVREICSTTSEPVLIFTGWTATARSLELALRSTRRVVVVTGRERTNAASLDAFTRGYADVLISTDVGAEGLNLQRAGVVIHYDLPWNPVKVDQRNGRAHRIGQTRSSVRAIYFLAERHRDEVLQKVAAKNRVRRRIVRVSSAEETEKPVVTTMRPRVAAGCAAAALATAATRAGLSMPAALERRHRAGLERFLADVARGAITDDVLQSIEAMLDGEPWALSLDRRFTNL